jgi:hypothetical protein
MSPEIALIVSPRSAYAELARRPVRVSAIAALRRPLVAALVIGTSLSLSSTGRVTPALVLGTALCWSYLVVAQIAIAVPFIAADARRTVGLPRAIDLFFTSHAPWSLLLLFAAAWSPTPLGRPLWPVLALALVPLFLTPRILVAFFREVLEMDPRRAVARTVAHQAVTWALFAGFFWIVNALSPRALELFA